MTASLSGWASAYMVRRSGTVRHPAAYRRSAQRLDEQCDAEHEERNGGADLDGALRQPGAELLADDDRQPIGRDHADRRPGPRADDAVVRRERDRREHRLVAQLGEEERTAGCNDRRARRA